jgi:DNA-binding phage protein
MQMAVSLRPVGGDDTKTAVTPLNEILLEAIEIAKRREPGLTELEIAERAGIQRTNLSRAKKRCGAAVLEAVFDALGLDLQVIEVRPTKTKKASK